MIKTLLKPLSFLPALMLMYMIYSFSAQPGEVSSEVSYKVSYKIVQTVDYVFDGGHEDWQLSQWADKINFITRKLAHMTEYFALAVAVSFPLYVYGLHGFLLMLTAGIICVGFACGDEYHQSFVAGRSPAVKDVCIDSFGVFWGIILVRIIGWTGRKTIFRPRPKKKRWKKENAAYENSYEQQPEWEAVPDKPKRKLFGRKKKKEFPEDYPEQEFYESQNGYAPQEQFYRQAPPQRMPYPGNRPTERYASQNATRKSPQGSPGNVPYRTGNTYDPQDSPYGVQDGYDPQGPQGNSYGMQDGDYDPQYDPQDGYDPQGNRYGTQDGYDPQYDPQNSYADPRYGSPYGYDPNDPNGPEPPVKKKKKEKDWIFDDFV